jgi:4'-phosphopantetheinyl transferase
MTEVFYTKIDPEMPETELLVKMLSAEKLERYHSLYFDDDRQRMLTGDWLVRSVLAKKLCCTPESIVLSYSSFGKPFLANDHGIYFNLSHSGNYVGAVFSNQEAGIDVEEIRPLKEPFATAGIFMSEREFSFFSDQPEETRQSWFYRIWTAKESFIKTKGKGISEGLQSITIDFSGSRVMAFKNEEPMLAYYFYEIAIDPGYKAFVCACDQFFRYRRVCSLKLAH